MIAKFLKIIQDYDIGANNTIYTTIKMVNSIFIQMP